MNVAQILACQGTAIYYIESQNLHFHKSGRLQILLSFDGLVHLQLDDFQYGVNPSVQIQYETSDPQFEMVFYMKRYPKGQWVIKINEHADEVFSCLNEKSYLKQKNKVSKYASYSSNSTKKEEVQVEKKSKCSSVKQKKKEQVKRESLDEEEDQFPAEKKQSNNQITVGTVLVGASKGIGWGLAWTGKILAKGVEGVGGMISKKVQPVQKVEVSQGTKANLQLAKSTTKNVLEFTAKQVGNLFNFGKQVACDIGERFEKSEKGKELKENPKYEMIKSGTATGVKVLANIYDGAVNAMYEIGSGASKGTSKVLAAKYGEQAGQAANQVLQGAGNIVKIARIPTDETYKAFKD